MDHLDDIDHIEEIAAAAIIVTFIGVLLFMPAIIGGAL